MLLRKTFLLLLGLSISLFFSTPVNGSYRLAILIDEDSDETPQEKNIQALTGILARLLHEQTAPVLVSWATLHNLLARLTFLNDPRHPENIELTGVPFYRSEWRIFEIEGTKFYLLLPYKYLRNKKIDSSFKAAGAHTQLALKFDHLTELSSLLPLPHGSFKELTSFIRKNPYPPAFAKIKLENLFLQQKHADRVLRQPARSNWIIYIVGHGGMHGSITGLHNYDLRELLDFFDNHLHTRLVYLDSCYIGGRNKQLLLRKEGKPYSFSLIAGGITDQPTLAFPDHMSFESFFSRVEQNRTPIFDSHTTHHLLDAARFLAPTISAATSRHGLTCLPQLLAPGTSTFEVLGKDQSTISLDNDPEEEKIWCIEKSAILLYRTFYNTPLYITPAREVAQFPDDSPYIAADYLNIHSFESFPLLKSLRSLNSFILKLKKKKMSPCTILKEARDHYSPPTALFPTFISMLHPDPFTTRFSKEEITYHRFKEIEVDNKVGAVASPFFGLLRFLYDAFLDIGNRHSKNVFLIDKLTGYNDFGLFFELYYHAQPHTSPARRDFFLFECPANLTLTNVVITTGEKTVSKDTIPAGEECFEFYISFECNNHCWQYRFGGSESAFAQAVPWAFKKASQDAHRIMYARLSNRV